LTGIFAVAVRRAPGLHHASSADEFRQLKAETYRTLLRVVTGRPMIALAERILDLGRDR